MRTLILATLALTVGANAQARGRGPEGVCIAAARAQDEKEIAAKTKIAGAKTRYLKFDNGSINADGKLVMVWDFHDSCDLTRVYKITVQDGECEVKQEGADDEDCG